MATDKEIIKAISLCSAEWPTYPVTDQTIIVWQHTLADIPADVLEQAVWHIITTGSDFFPHVSTVRSSAFAIVMNTQGIPTEYEAYQEACRAKPETSSVTEENGKFQVSHEPYKWSHPLVEKTAKTLGWPDLFPTDNIAADRAHFRDAFNEFLAREEMSVKTLPQVKQFAENYQLTNGIKALAEKLSVKE